MRTAVQLRIESPMEGSETINGLGIGLTLVH